MNRGGDGEGLAQRLFLILQIGYVLEIVCIHVAVCQQFIGIYAAGQFDHLQIQARIDFLDVVKDLRMRNRVSRYA